MNEEQTEKKWKVVTGFVVTEHRLNVVDMTVKSSHYLTNYGHRENQVTWGPDRNRLFQLGVPNGYGGHAASSVGYCRLVVLGTRVAVGLFGGSVLSLPWFVVQWVF